MRALVTGSAGFVGRHLVPKLRASGYDDIVCVDPRGPLSSGPAATFDWFTENCSYLFEHVPFDLVVHLAANIINVDARMKGGMEMFDDIALDLEFCKWLEKNPPTKCAVLMSSCATDSWQTDPYAFTKLALEQMAQTLHKKGVPVIVLKPFSGYGEDQTEEYPFRAILERALRKEDPLTVWGSGDQLRDWIHVNDLTDAILFAIDKVPPSANPIEVGTAVGATLRTVARMIAAEVGYFPLIGCDSSKPASSGRRVANSAFSGKDVLQNFGWHPKIDLEEGIRRAVAAKMAIA